MIIVLLRVWKPIERKRDDRGRNEKCLRVSKMSALDPYEFEQVWMKFNVIRH